ncbi:MAG TPA: hypothetical protein VKP04_04400 [Ktedonobacteraceae bacterium]|nr:hypothetical protein [Ktedonobacteraceae bacterium]
MSETTSAVINVSKSLAGVPLAALAWAGGATSIPWLAALLSLPSAILLASDTIGAQVAKLESQKDELIPLEISRPGWWTSDSRSWQNVCTEIVDHFPAILKRMAEYMRQEQRVKTMEVVQQVFIDALVLEQLTWASQPEERRKIGAVVASPILQNMGEILDPVIKQILQEEAFKDLRRTAENTDVLKEIHRALVPPALSSDEMTDLRQHYCQTLHERWKMLDFRGIMHADMNRPISIPLSEVFILPKVLVGVPEYETLEREEDYENNDTNGEEQERLWEEEQERLEQRGRSQRIDLLPILQREDFRTVMTKHRRLVILGDPGSGKSTLLRYLLLQLSQGG